MNQRGTTLVSVAERAPRVPVAASSERGSASRSASNYRELAEFARYLNLGPAMRLGHGEEQAGGRTRDLLLCATFEALVGALYLQSDIPFIQKFIHPMLQKASEEILLRSDLQDPKSRLQEWSQGHKLGIPQYITLHSLGPDHNRTFEVEVHINGKVHFQRYVRGAYPPPWAR